jgi:AraC-like DNA-binding protein
MSMKKLLRNQISYDELSTLFIKNAGHQSTLKPSFGKGLIRVFKLEKGLCAYIWECQFNEDIELYNTANSAEGHQYFTLAFFPCMHGLQLADQTGLFLKNSMWDTVFTSSELNFRIALSPKSKNCCLSVSFSEKWLYNNLLQGNEALQSVLEKISSAASFPIFESMNTSEKKQIHELLDRSGEKWFGTFYIKAAVLDVVYNFFQKIRDVEDVQTTNFHLDTVLTEVEKYLCSHITGKLPNLKGIANRFSISESTLKRHFAKHFGRTMSAYFTMRKMEYAEKLMQERNLTVSETARAVGYNNAHNFLTMYKKYSSFMLVAIT